METNLQWINFSSHITFEARESYLKLTDCDVRLVVDNLFVDAHKIILSTASDFFKEILLNIPQYEETAIIIIPGIEFSLLKYAIDFIYTGETEIPSTNIDEFIEICDFLGLKSILKKCTNLCENAETIITDSIIEYDESSFITSSLYEINDGTFNEIPVNEIPVHEIENTTDILGEEQLTEIKPKKLKQKIKRQKKCVDNAKLQCAVKEVEAGKTFREAARHYQIPLSSLYAFTKQKQHNVKRQGRQSLYDKNRISKAVESITSNELSYKKAEEKYGIPKTILWRHVKKTPITTNTPRKARNELKLKAIQEIEKGECLIEVCKKYDIAISTLYREKRKLYVKGELPSTSSVKAYKRITNFDSQVKLAVEACQKGLSQGIASVLYNVPKTTIWRHLKKIRNENNIESQKSEIS